MQLEVRAESWAYATPFRITDFVFTAAEVLVVTLRDGPYAAAARRLASTIMARRRPA